MRIVKRYSTQVRERTVQMVTQTDAHHGLRGAAIRSAAEKIGCSAQSVRRWLAQDERNARKRDGLTRSQRDRLKFLERENRKLKRTNEILRTASALLLRAGRVGPRD